MLPQKAAVRAVADVLAAHPVRVWPPCVRSPLRSRHATLYAPQHNIEYRSFLSNHLMHGTVALAALGDTRARLDAWASHYCQRLEPPLPLPDAPHAADAAWRTWRGDQGNYPRLLSYFRSVVARDGCDETIAAHWGELYVRRLALPPPSPRALSLPFRTASRARHCTG